MPHQCGHEALHGHLYQTLFIIKQRCHSGCIFGGDSRLHPSCGLRWRSAQLPYQVTNRHGYLAAQHRSTRLRIGLR